MKFSGVNSTKSKEHSEGLFGLQFGSFFVSTERRNDPGTEKTDNYLDTCRFQITNSRKA